MILNRRLRSSDAFCRHRGVGTFEVEMERVRFSLVCEVSTSVLSCFGGDSSFHYSPLPRSFRGLIVNQRYPVFYVRFHP